MRRIVLNVAFRRRHQIELILLMLATLSSAQNKECSDIQPPNSSYTCIQHAKWGRCSSYELKLDGYCQQTCGYCNFLETIDLDEGAILKSMGAATHQESMYFYEEEIVAISQENDVNIPPCFDIPPDEIHTCVEQKEWGKCEAWWMKKNFCRVTCGQCKLEGEKYSQVPACSDTPPDDIYTCDEQKKFGKCDEAWMRDRGFCQKTCNECYDGSNIQIIEVLPSQTLTNTQSCSPIDLFEQHPEIKDFTVAYNFLKTAVELQGSSSNLRSQMEKKGFEGVILIPVNEAITRYQANINDTAWIEIAKFHIVPGELNRDVIGPYEVTLNGSPVLLIKDEYVENELRTSGALVLKTYELFNDPLCSGQELDVWIIDSLLFPPTVDRPTLVKQTPLAYQPHSFTPSPQPIQVSPTEQITVTATLGLEELLLIDQDYQYQYADEYIRAAQDVDVAMLGL